jgi:ABC-type Fe3+-hydroxamate transport system substrate-binding protein
MLNFTAVTSFTDQTGHIITLQSVPERIISIVPSQSELLWEMGLRDELKGISKFCIHPDRMFRTVQRVGGTKQLDIEKIRALKPQLIIGNKEENEKAQIETLRREFNVWMSDIYNFDDAIEMMRALGNMTGKKQEAEAIVNKVKDSISSIKNIFNGETMAYFIWKDPYMLAAGNTFIDHVLRHAGLVNVAGSMLRYPEISVEDIRKIKPAYCFLSSEPYPFSEKHLPEIKRQIPDSKIVLVDGEMFSWYGSRLTMLPEYLEKLKTELA